MKVKKLERKKLFQINSKMKIFLSNIKICFWDSIIKSMSIVVLWVPILLK